jgi:hypothetical protein
MDIYKERNNRKKGKKEKRKKGGIQHREIERTNRIKEIK